MLPIETIAKVLLQLYQQREQIKMIIYEITGISDILRGSSKSNETARAQEIKSQFGTLRLQKRQARVAKFMRDIIRMMGEVIAEHFTQENLAQMTGVELMTAEQKQMAQMQAQIASANQQEVPKELQDALMKPTWEDVQGVLHSDSMRGYRIDIETDSTVQQQVVAEQRDITELLNGVVTFLQGVAPAIHAGAMPVDTAKTLLLAAVRRFRLGNEVEDALSKMEAPQGPSPEMQQMQQQMQQAQQSVEQEKQAIGAQKQQLQEQATQKGMQLSEREHALQLKELQATYERQLMDRDRQAYEQARGLEERLTRLQSDGERAMQMDKEAGYRQTGDALAQHMKAVEGFAAQVQEALTQMAQAVAQQGEQMAQSVQQIQASVEAIGAFQRAPKRVVRGQDGSISVQEARTVQ